jgi:hypothetical protein
MGLRSSKSCRSHPAVVVPRAFVEIVVAITASVIMALMVAGGGIAAERWAIAEDVAAQGSGPEPPSLSWRETT